MNSLYNPADSLTPILHSPIRNGLESIGTCANCNSTVSFNKSIRRWESSAWNGMYCKEAK